MTKKTLIKISAIADSLDIITGWIPGPWSFVVDVPVIICHFMYAGPRAVWVLADNIPVVGVLPIYTIAAMAYPDKQKVINVEGAPVAHSPSTPPVIDAEIVSSESTNLLSPIANGYAVRK